MYFFVADNLGRSLGMGLLRVEFLQVFVYQMFSYLVCLLWTVFLNMCERNTNNPSQVESKHLCWSSGSPARSLPAQTLTVWRASQPTLFGAERHASLRWWPGQQRPSCGNQQPAWPNSGWWSPLNWCYQGEALHLAVGKCEHTCQIVNGEWIGAGLLSG